MMENNNGVFGYLILGFKEIAFKSLVLLYINEDYEQLVLSYKVDDQEKNIYFNYDSILKIEYKKEPLIEYEDKKTTVDGGRDYSRPVIRRGSYYRYQREDISYVYQKANIKTIYRLIVNVMYEGEAKEIVINTDQNPEVFVNKIKEKM